MFFHLVLIAFIALMGTAWALVDGTPAQEGPLYLFNRPPLTPKPYTELPLGTIAPDGWLKDELTRMAAGMTGHLDAWYPEVAGPRNAWLGGDGDTWERGPYWIDGLYPLSRLLWDEQLIAKALPWVEWTLENQREDGYIGPRLFDPGDRTRPPPRGAQIHKPDDWWPRMVMLKILQQHFLATGDVRVIEVMRKYFRYQLKNLPGAPLQAPEGGMGGSWWARQRGGDNLMVILWFYNLTGEPWLLELADIIYEQTLPWTGYLLDGDALKLQGGNLGSAYGMHAFHCVNLAMGMKTPIIRFQQDHDMRHRDAVRKAFVDIAILHGQPHGLYGADEAMHGRRLDRGSELCTAVEMMYSLEKMMEITGDVAFADRLEKVAFNVLPTQCTDDHHGRQYFQQANQVLVTAGPRSFFNDGDRLVYGLLQGYPCCTCNYHQGWPKFVQHLWMAGVDRGLAALVYGPCRVTAKVADGTKVTIIEETVYPFEETIRFTIAAPRAVEFPLHLRIPGWCRKAKISVNAKTESQPNGGQVVALKRLWQPGDCVELVLPMEVRTSSGYERSVAVSRGPLVYALRIEEEWTEVEHPAPDGTPAGAMHRGYRECRPKSPWNYALLESALGDIEKGFNVVKREQVPANPWNLAGAPIELETRGVCLPEWTLYNKSAGPVPLSPVPIPNPAEIRTIRLIPYGCTTLRISGFPWVNDARTR